MGDLDWGILDDIDPRTLPFKLEDCLGIYSNGMGDYACVDLNSSDKKKGFMWWKSRPPKLNIDIWPVVDEWPKMSIEE